MHFRFIRSKLWPQRQIDAREVTSLRKKTMVAAPRPWHVSIYLYLSNVSRRPGPMILAFASAVSWLTSLASGRLVVCCLGIMVGSLLCFYFAEFSAIVLRFRMMSEWCICGSEYVFYRESLKRVG